MAKATYAKNFRFLYFPVVSGSATNLVLSVVEKKKEDIPILGHFLIN